MKVFRQWSSRWNAEYPYGTFAPLVPTIEPPPAQRVHALPDGYYVNRPVLLRGVYTAGRSAAAGNAYPFSRSPDGHFCAAGCAHDGDSDGHPPAYRNAHSNGHVAAHCNAAGDAFADGHAVANGHVAAYAQRDAYSDGDPVAHAGPANGHAGAGLPDANRDTGPPHADCGAHLYTGASHADAHTGTNSGGYSHRNAHTCAAVALANTNGCAADGHPNSCANRPANRHTNALALTDKTRRFMRIYECPLACLAAHPVLCSRASGLWWSNSRGHARESA